MGTLRKSQYGHLVRHHGKWMYTPNRCGAPETALEPPVGVSGVAGCSPLDLALRFGSSSGPSGRGGGDAHAGRAPVVSAMGWRFRGFASVMGRC